MKNLKKLTAILLCISLLFTTSFSINAQNAAKTNTTADEQVITTVENTGLAEPYIIGELKEKRTENTKHFLMSDRSIMAAVYEKSVHYKDGEDWVDIDNSFSTDNENDFENKSNGFKTKFSKKSNGNKLVTITKDNNSLSWMLDDANKVNAEISQSNESENDDISALKNIEGVITYPDIQNNVDLQYVVSGTDVKENIILQSADAPKEYSFTYKFNKLKYRTNDNNQIEFYEQSNPEDVVFVIDKPYMYDADKAYSDSIEMQISEISNGFKLTLIPSEEWLLSEDRVYPIVIDPTTLSSQKATSVWDIEVRNTQTSSFWYKAGDFLVGSDSNGQVYRTLLKFCDLPNIGAGGIVVNAKMNITAYQGPAKDGDPSLRTRPTDDIQVNIHRITAEWPEQGVVWNDYANSYNSVVEDYFIYNDTSEAFTGDITKLVSGWYSGTYSNYGIMLKANNESAANHVMQFASSDWGINNTNSATWRPILLVNYRTCIGLEDYWSYTTQDMGGYGTGYINNYNGNLTYVHNDISFNSLINGFTLSHVYNGANSNSSTGRFGKGWGINLVQTFQPVTIENNDAVKYAYIDGDGTKHYFVEIDDNKIVDEDGLGYTFSSIDEGELIYKLTDKDKNILKFDQWGALRRIIDSNGNTINLNYSPVTNRFNYLSTITTSSGGAIYLHYDSEYKLSYIVDNSGRTTYFSYTNGNLTKITYPDGTDLDFTYYSGDNGVSGSSSWLHGVTLPNGYQYKYGNYDNGKVYMSTEQAASGTQINKYYYTYSNNKTNVRDLQDRYINYLFDSFGRVTCAYDSEGNSYSESYTTNSTQERIFENNKLSLASNNIRNINNLITNPSFTDGLSPWTQYEEAPGQTEISVVSDQPYVSSKSAKISSTASSIQALLQIPNTTAGKTYTLSANIKTENVISETHGATVEIVKSTPNGNSSYFYDFVTGTTDPEINNGFVTVSVTVSLESDENIARIGVGLYNASGTVWINSVQLEEGDTANKINLLSNSSFEKNTGSSALPTGYTANFTAGTAGGSTSADKHSGSYSLKIAGSATVKRYAYQTLNLSGNAGDVYSMGGWAKANAVANHSSNGVTDFKLTAGVYYTDGTYVEYPFDLNEHTTEWQYVFGNFIMKKNYNKILVYCSYNFNANTAYFDDMFLYRDTAQSYTYDENGNVISTADYAKQQSSFEYSDNNLTKVINPNGTEYTYEYDDNKNLTKASSNIGVSYNYSYDSHGNSTGATVTADGTDETITSSATYQNNGNFPSTVTDSRGNTTTYTYDTARGLQTGITDALGNSTTYSYNSLNDRLNSVTNGNSTVSYSYKNDGSLNNITSPSGTVYNFAYDEFGNTTQVSVGENILTKNTYNSQGLLISSLYGSGESSNYMARTGVYQYETIDYEYDILDRVTEKLYNDIPRITYRYDKFGNLYEKQDLFTYITYRYSYDLIGRTTGINGSDGTSINYVYDEYNRTQKYIAKFADKSNATEYIYGDSDVSGQKDGLIYGVKQNGTKRITYNYDSLARLNTRTLNTTIPFVTQYTYYDGAESGATTTLVKTIQNGNDVYEYAYDAVGNITCIKLNGAVYESYTYDNLNQLKTVTRGSDTYSYTYDSGGNILSVTLNGNEIKSYGYTDSDWKDKLMSFNGETITYDEIGNPLTYRNGFVFDWANGRRLTNVTKDDTNISYIYNADGLRASKTVNDNTTVYYWLDGMLLGEKTGNNTITYLYDENGTIYGFVFNNSYYYYSFNAQGDVVAIMDKSGKIVARYSYDAWGNILSITDGSGNSVINNVGHIANRNPIRYRGYYHDNETGFYLTGTRYYDPEIGRFINADSVISGTGESVQGYNLFAYCFNNPVNMSDPSGNWPKWATKLVAAVAVVAVVAAVAAVTVATAGAGTAIAAVAVGAAKGAAIGFAVGAASGAAIGYATTGTLEGTLNGMADGALSGSISGAITGGVNGYSNYSSAANFLKSNGANPKEVLSSYKGTPKVQTLKTDTTVYRTWGGTTQELGHWVSPNNYGSSARNLLSLPIGNTMTNTSSFLLPKGTTVLAGKAAPLFGQSGGGVQWWISVLE